MYLGDFGVGQSVSTKFPTTKSDGTPTSLSAGAASVYRTGSTTESTAGVTLTADYDARTGFNSLVVDTSADATFYTPGSEYQVVLTAGTVNAISVVGQPVASFSIRNRPGPVMSAPFSNAGIHSAGG